MRIFSIFLFKTINIVLPLCGTSNRPCHAVREPLLTRGRWKAEHVEPYLSDSDIVVDTKDLDKLLLKYARALTDKDGS